MDLCERGIHWGLAGDTKVEGASMDGRASRGGDEEDEQKSRS